MDFLLELSEPWVHILVGLLALAESAAFVGLVAPGEATMIMGGVLVSRGHAEPHWMIVAATLGAVAGDSISYELGRRFGPRLVDGRFGRRIGQPRWERAARYLKRRGGWAIFLGRFVGVLRPLVPAAAGTAGMPYRRFLVANVVGGALWAAGSVGIGIAAGESWHLVDDLLQRASLGLGLVVVTGAALAFAVRWARRDPETARSRLLCAARPPWTAPIPVPRGFVAPSGDLTTGAEDG